MYKILLPITTSVRLIREKMKVLHGYEDKLIVVNNWTEKQVEKEAKEFAARGAEVWNCTYNLGLAGTWNFGMKRMMDDGCDFVIILAPSAKFSDTIQRFIDAIQEHQAKKPMARYIASGTATLHCFAQTRYGVELGGYFDENFWPIYYEDTDYCHRSKFNGIGTPPADIAERSSMNEEDGLKVKNFTMNDLVKSESFSISCNSNNELMRLHQMNTGRWSNYYQRKWGGNHGSEQYSRPFNDPNKGVNDWEIEGPFWHNRMPHPWTPPAPTERY